METLIEWAKENYDLICWIIGLIGVIIAVISFVYELKRKRKEKQK